MQKLIAAINTVPVSHRDVSSAPVSQSPPANPPRPSTSSEASVPSPRLCLVSCPAGDAISPKRESPGDHGRCQSCEKYNNVAVRYM